MIRFGIIGAGSIAHKFARDIKHATNATLHAIASRSLDKATAFQKEFKLDEAYGSYEEMLKNAKIDAVYIATPHNFHHDQALMSLHYNKHVLVEKPFAVNKKQAEDMISVAKEEKLFIMEAMWSRFLPASKYVRELVTSRELGNLESATLTFGYSLIEDYPNEKRLLNPNLAGGSILDIGVYPISFLHYLHPKLPTKITAKAEFYETGVDTNCHMSFVYDDGLTATLESSISKTLGNDASFNFEAGTLHMKDFSRSTHITVDGKPQTIPFKAEGFPHEIESFVTTILDEKLDNETMSHKATLEVMEIMDRIRKQINLEYPFE